MTNKPFQDYTAVVTGAASGIGQALALKLASLGANLAIADLDNEGLAETERQLNNIGGKTKCYLLDVAKLSDIQQFAADVQSDFQRIDIVVNNAGIGMSSPLSDTPYKDFEKLLGINMWGVIYGSQEFLPFLKQQPHAYLVNISSVLGLFAMPELGVYNTSKFAVRGYTETLQQELADSSVHVACVHPGFIKTNIAKNSHIKDPKKLADGVKRFEENAKTTATIAADIIVSGMLKNKPRILVGRDAVFLDLVQRLLPTHYHKVLNKLMPK